MVTGLTTRENISENQSQEFDESPFGVKPRLIPVNVAIQVFLNVKTHLHLIGSLLVGREQETRWYSV